MMLWQQLHSLANPLQFRRWAEPLAPVLVFLGIAILFVSWGAGLLVDAATVDQNESARIFFVHVPMAIGCTVVYTFMALFSLVGIVLKHELAHVATHSMAPLGLVITVMAFVTGAVWGLDDWGQGLLFEEPRSMLTDPRLLSVELLCLQYIAYLGLVSLFDNPAYGRQAGAVFVLASVITVVFVRYSPIWFNSVHQGSTLMNTDAIKPDIYVWITVSSLFALASFVVGLTLWRVIAHLDMQKTQIMLKQRLANSGAQRKVVVE